MSDKFIGTRRFVERRAALLLIGNLRRSLAVYVTQSINNKYCIKCSRRCVSEMLKQIHVQHDATNALLAVTFAHV